MINKIKKHIGYIIIGSKDVMYILFMLLMGMLFGNIVGFSIYKFGLWALLPWLIVFLLATACYWGKIKSR